MSQEDLAEASFHAKCYLPIATIKRAETGRPVSKYTLKKYSIFFSIDEEQLLRKQDEKLKELPYLHSQIDWQKAIHLTGSVQSTKLSFHCREILNLLRQFSNDDQLHSPFIHLPLSQQNS